MCCSPGPGRTDNRHETILDRTHARARNHGNTPNLTGVTIATPAVESETGNDQRTGAALTDDCTQIHRNILNGRQGLAPYSNNLSLLALNAFDITFDGGPVRNFV
jgi:hypothetical protein